MRVAMICAHGSPLAAPGRGEAGGLQLYVRELARHLGRLGVLVDIFTRRLAPETASVVALAPGVRVVSLPAGPMGPLPRDTAHVYLPALLGRIEQFATAEGLAYDLVHSHYWLSAWVGMHLARRWGVPHLVMFHTLALLKERARYGVQESPLRLPVERRVLQTADGVVVATEHERQAIADLYGGACQSIRVIPGGVDLERFRPLERPVARQMIGGLDPADEVLLFVGRMDPVKGLELLLKAVGLLRERQRLRVLVVGGDPDDPLHRQYRALAEALGVLGPVRFLGAVPHADLPRYYSAADLCVVPSHYESFGLVAAEALACGTPVVASRVGGLLSIVRDGENGLLVPWRCPQAFAEAIERLLDDAALRAQLAGAARASVAHLGWPVVAAQVAACYQALSRAVGRRQRRWCGR